jgi:hypothetical protein
VRLASISGISISPPALPTGDRPIDVEELGTALTTIAKPWGSLLKDRTFENPEAVDGGEFALLAAELLLKSVRPLR